MKPGSWKSLRLRWFGCTKQIWDWLGAAKLPDVGQAWSRHYLRIWHQYVVQGPPPQGLFCGQIASENWGCFSGEMRRDWGKSTNGNRFQHEFLRSKMMIEYGPLSLELVFLVEQKTSKKSASINQIRCVSGNGVYPMAISWGKWG
jgi:hypothetical protein